MLKEALKNSSIIYYTDYCEKCGGVSHWGELIAVKNITGGEGWSFICPKCYVKSTKRAIKIPTCLTNPERLEELLERYKE